MLKPLCAAPFGVALILFAFMVCSGFNASHYGDGDGFHGRRTACGGVHDKNGMTTAHRTLPCGTRVLITNKANGKSVVVTVSDRGPFIRGREWDLSSGAARLIGITGLGNVTGEVLK